MNIDNDVSTTSWLAQHISQFILSFSLNHDIPSPSLDADSELSNGITENIISSIHEVGEAEDSSYDDEYLSDDEPLVQGFIGISFIPEGSSVSEQSALRAITQGVYWKEFATSMSRVSRKAEAAQSTESLRP